MICMEANKLRQKGHAEKYWGSQSFRKWVITLVAENSAMYILYIPSSLEDWTVLLILRKKNTPISNTANSKWFA